MPPDRRKSHYSLRLLGGARAPLARGAGTRSPEKPGAVTPPRGSRARALEGSAGVGRLTASGAHDEPAGLDEELLDVALAALPVVDRQAGDVADKAEGGQRRV